MAARRTPPFDLAEALAHEARAAGAALGDADAARAIHQGRVRLKRFRALARLAQAAAPNAARSLNAKARAAMAGLSDARDLAALAAGARAAAIGASGKARLGLLETAAALEAERIAMAHPPIAAARETAAALEAAVASLPKLDAHAIEKGARRLVKRARRAFHAARDAAGDEPRHTWRKREKDRLFAEDVLGPAWPKTLARRRRRAKRLARVLGAERDLLLLRARIKATPKIAGGRGLARKSRAFLTTQIAALAEKADRLGAALHRTGG
jgi:hypothetical protein